MSWHPSFDALSTRWLTFLDKLQARVQEIGREAAAAYADVIRNGDLISGTAMSGVSSMFHARLNNLVQKVDDAWSTISNESDAIELPDGRASGRWQGAMLTKRAELEHWLRRESEWIIVKGEADVARALHAIATEAAKATIPCPQCGTSLGQPLWHRAMHGTCPRCGTVSVMTPAPAAAMFIQGSATISLAREAAWEYWCAMQDAERAWRKLRHPTLDDLARWESANRSYWQAYASAMGSLNPGWSAQDVANEVTGKMSHFLMTTSRDDRTVRETNGRGIAAVAAADQNGVIAWIRASRDPDGAAEALITAALERGWTQHATWVAQVAQPVVAAGDHTWAANKLDEVTYYMEAWGR
jgi:hypothetical protein